MSDRIIIVNNYDGTADVIVNEETIDAVPTTNLDSNIHAVQWYGDHGEVEYSDHNEEITDFSEFGAIITDRQTEIDRRVNEAIENEPSEEDAVLDERHRLLLNTDWIVSKYAEIGNPIPKEWSDYRQELRDITEQDGYPGSIIWPEEPTTTP